MRYFDFTLTPEDGAIHPADRIVAEHPALTREALMHVDALADGTGVMLYRILGDPEGLPEELEASEYVVDWDMLDVRDERFHLYLHVLPGDPAGTLMALTQRFALMVDTPIEFTGRGGIQTTVVGTHEMLQQAVEQLPDSVQIDVEQVGQYQPNRTDMLSTLTDRQLEVFRTAVDLGYYEIPRQTTHEDIADRLECAPSTVDEHLRKAESRVLSSLVRG
ncbi:helix-turn-helix domain-containing protein [Salinirubellus salinus]|uniref:Helix-turn-helix domain-containing protein n=1 Tax=Salinirubellus salinus TaxID=1364945 RepID=A0A9E7R5K2_9EURY|nr:helix-turn-helix domain-containing protein [Salinirubellus salinus]UWM56316.1 helix-turn-helix domain-containing protein [Salinirubellus salinus]